MNATVWAKPRGEGDQAAIREGLPASKICLDADRIWV
jgi:hypothetical protein